MNYGAEIQLSADPYELEWSDASRTDRLNQGAIARTDSETHNADPDIYADNDSFNDFPDAPTSASTTCDNGLRAHRREKSRALKDLTRDFIHQDTHRKILIASNDTNSRTDDDPGGAHSTNEGLTPESTHVYGGSLLHHLISLMIHE